ncbi:hypothetical protein PInf_004283 [Phytophthora infestans]|nr:hypothetical protein PInf_004283 [Phytophthora infestans]
MMNALAKKTEVASFADLSEWAGLRLCDSAIDFFSAGGFDRTTDETTFSSKPPQFRNETLVLKCFRHFYDEEGKTYESFGLVMTTRRVFRNVLYAVEGQDQDGVFASTDGTYKLHYGGWVLVAFGTYQSHFTAEKKYSKSFVPWAYMFVRTEHQFAFTTLFRTVLEKTQIFFGVDLNVRFGSLDHAACIANSYKEVWPDITLLDCYPHLTRKSHEKRIQLKPVETSSAYYQDNIKVNITQMHKTRTPAQFGAVSKKLCLQRWRADGQHEYAAWFEKIYLTDTWTRWYTTSGAPDDTIHQAVRHTSSSMYYKKTKVVNRKRVPRSFLFNVTEYMDTDTDPACEVTKVRVDRYLEAKVGKLRESDTVEDINVHYLCLHEVEILDHSDRAKTFQLQLHPVISMDNIREIRALFRCDCKMFWSTGKQFDLTVAKKILPTTKLCGGQRKIAGALFIDAPDCRTFSIPSLEKKLTKKPHYPYGWQIAKDFAVVVNGEEEDISMIITIQAYSSRGGRYRWLVDFEGGKLVFLECQKLVQLIVESRRTGLDVTKSAAAHANTHELHPRSVDRDADDDQDLDS